jgi:hypothetical protein
MQQQQQQLSDGRVVKREADIDAKADRITRMLEQAQHGTKPANQLMLVFSATAKLADGRPKLCGRLPASCVVFSGRFPGGPSRPTKFISLTLSGALNFIATNLIIVSAQPQLLFTPEEIAGAPRAAAAAGAAAALAPAADDAAAAEPAAATEEEAAAADDDGIDPIVRKLVSAAMAKAVAAAMGRRAAARANKPALPYEPLPKPLPQKPTDLASLLLRRLRALDTTEQQFTKTHEKLLQLQVG